MSPMTMDLPKTLENEEATNGHAATDPLVPETALDEAGKELAGGEAPAQVDELPAQDTAAQEDSGTPATKPKKTADEKAADKATKHYEKRKREAEENLSNCVLHRRECEAQLKSAKSSEKAAAELLEHVLAKGPEQLPLFDKPTTNGEAAVATDPEAVGLSPDPNAAAGPLKVHDPDAWRQRPISALGLHPGLEEKLVSDGIDTIGRLEQRRADISQGKEKWPKGIGKAKVTLIEEAVLSWLAANQQPAEPTEAEIKQAVVDRAKELNTGDADCLEPAGETDAEWDSGVAAFDRGQALTDCPYIAGTEQDDWLKGWMTAKENKDGETISSDLGDL